MATHTEPVRYDVSRILTDMAEKGWLATHLAQHSGLSGMTIGRFLSGHTQTAPTAKKIAAALGRSVRRYILSASSSSNLGPDQSPAEARS